MSDLERDVVREIFSLRINEPDEYSSFEIDEAQGELEYGLSPLARRDHGLHKGHGVRNFPWRDNVYGLVVHTTGGSLPGEARKAGIPPDKYAVNYYLTSGGTHYVNGWAGAEGQQLHQVMNERQVAWGVGRARKKDKSTGKLIIDKSIDQWTSIEEGRFERDLSPTVLRLQLYDV